MKNRAPVALFVALLLGLAAPARAQQGVALKGHFLFNSSAVSTERTDTFPDASGISLGAELVLPLGIGVGVSAYTSSGSDSSLDTSTLTGLAEANYFFRLPLLPIAPYAGVHAGLGRYSKEDLRDPRRPEVEDTWTQLGYQVGVRVQLNSLLGVDAQYRRVSNSAAEDQEGDLERNQFLLGVTLF
ncbi:MAG TPA: outer membrane beta-barrel protein [Longimicrobiaceae bacterium]|nr:outer membrane beta-barrel protein [Longimicrobiaceae bacterium]